MESRMGLFSERARSKASGPHGYQGDRVMGVLEEVRARLVCQGVQGETSRPGILAQSRNGGLAHHAAPPARPVT